MTVTQPTLPASMTVVEMTSFGDPDVLHLAQQTLPELGENDILIKVAAAGVNRADLLQRQGKYPQPPGASSILGLEVAGVVAARGARVHRWKIGDKVCALLAGGGYAAYAAVPETHCLPVPDALSLSQAAVLPEAVATVYANVFESGALRAGEIALIHGGSSGIGTTAIQMVKAKGGRVFTTVGTEEKAATCRALGADLCINYRTDDFVAAVKEATGGRGVDVILDMVGGRYLNRNLEALAPQGRHISIATQSGNLAEIDLRLIMRKNLTVTGSTLRNRPAGEKSRLFAEIEEKIWPLVAAGQIHPVLNQLFPLKNVAEAHKMMESGAHIGKIGLEVS